MHRMLDLVRASALPSHQMMSASKGALRLPPEEMVEILVYLTDHKIFGEPARMTLAGWDEVSSKTIASDPKTAKEVLDYWLAPKNLRASLFPLLLENAAVRPSKLAELGSTLKGEWIDAMIASPRVKSLRQVLTEMSANKNLSGVQAARLQEIISGKTASEVVAEAAIAEDVHQPAEAAADAVVAVSGIIPANAEPPVEVIEAHEAHDPEVEDALVAFFTEHADEIAAAGNKPFQAIGGIHDEFAGAPATVEEIKTEQMNVGEITQVKVLAAAASSSVAIPQPAVKTVISKKPVNPNDEQRGSVLQKIARLDIKGRIQLAMKGTKEERSILVRDGTKIVALAVLDSPKISDGEVEKFASQRNVLEAVLRGIPLKRRFMKNYAVVRNLVFNPRTPLDISLALMKNLLVADLRNLCGNKEVADTVRKLALRMFKQKADSAGKK
jgi:hypothetical protein